MRLLFATALTLLAVGYARAAGPACPAGMPLGSFTLTVTRNEGSDPIALNRINRLEEGDRISYTPVLKPREKRPGEVTIVLIAANPNAGDHQDFSVLDPASAAKPARWTVPYRSALALYVYGPAGLSSRKLRGFLANDQELVAQLADYAEKTAQTESVLQALSAYEVTGRTEGVQSALAGFAGQYGNANKIDRTAPLDQQTLAAMRTLNPALSAYDPISPSGSQRIAQTAGLATTVAGMFLGSTVGLAAGSAAMALNLKTLMFPDTEFRSAYTSASIHDTALCSGREPNPGRKRRAYLWAIRIPNAGPPSVAVGEANHLPESLAAGLRVHVSDADWKLVSRVRDWSLRTDDGKRIAVGVASITDGHQLELNPSKAVVPPGSYTLDALWDWDPFRPAGQIVVEPLGSFRETKLTSDSVNKLREATGKQVVTLEGGDFQFVEKVSVVRDGDKYASPLPVPFSLPLGPRRGQQTRLEMQVDTASMTAGTYNLTLAQQGGSTQTVPVQVVKAPPVIESLPLTVHCGMQNEPVLLSGEGLDRISGLEAAGVRFEMEVVNRGSKSLAARVTTDAKWSPGKLVDLRVSIRDYSAPLLMANAVLLAGERPVIRDVEPSAPSGLPIALRKGELLAGVMTNLLLHVEGASASSALTLNCRGQAGEGTTVRPGSDEDRIRLQPAQGGSMFLSLDAGRWPAGCVLTAVLQTAENGRSKAVELGTVIRMPGIDSFRLTDESAGEGMFTGILTGKDLELIEKTGWDGTAGQPVIGLPASIIGEGNKQSLKVRMAWPSPTPHAPLYLWLRGEAEGRATMVRY